VSVNMMLGPGPSSVAMRVIGTGLLENLGWEAWRESVGRSERTEAGRVPDEASAFVGILSTSFREAGLLLVPSELALSEDARLETEGGFLLGLSDLLNVRSGAEAAGGTAPLVESVVTGSVSSSLAEGRSGTLISLSPVDFFDGGGPRIESPWLLRLRIF
jgi:hypothetical protein